MKIHYFIATFLVTFFANSQVEQKDFDRMVESERKSASNHIMQRVNLNTQNYDVTYHILDFTVNPNSTTLNGKVTTNFTALSTMNTVTFDFYKKTTAPFTISSVKINNVTASFVHSATHELVITLPSTLVSGSSATAEIIYSGIPSTLEGAYTTRTRPGTTIKEIYTLSEPFGARDWWPCKQDLNDKADSIDVYITAPSQYVAVSNGVEPNDATYQVISGSNKTTHFKHNYPIPAYLVCMAVSNYQIYNQQGGLGTSASTNFPIINYIYPESSSTSISNLSVTPDIINFFESIIGPYPFRDEKYGHAMFGISGGMEHSTVSFMVNFNRDLVSHEMAHQWFGDKITCGSWKDIWLNEGITEYMSGCTVENFDGTASFDSWKANKIYSITNSLAGGVFLTDVEATNVNRIFSSRLTYNKGSMVNHMLRKKMGSANYFQALRNYLANPTFAYKYALTPDYQTQLENVFGSSLSEFFNDWIYNQGYPTYNVVASNLGPGQANIYINQTQSDPSVSFFEMPVSVRLTGSGGQSQDFVLDNTFNSQAFTVNVPFVISGVQFDPNNDIISRNNTASFSLSTASFSNDNAVFVFPNPSSSSIEIKIPDDYTFVTTKFYNSLGQMVLEKNQRQISVESLSNGIYSIEVIAKEGTFHKKFIKN